MAINGMSRTLLSFYDLAWAAAAPLLWLAPRLRQGYAQRILRQGPAAWPNGFTDIWIQAASAGESYLARELLLALPGDAPLSVLATSCTSQGLGILERAADDAAQANPALSCATAYFPFDKPSLMERALDRLQPKVLVLLETELWPGLMAACRNQGVPMVVANGRMTSKSLAGYLTAGRLFKDLAPDRVLAISEEAASRFRLVFGMDAVELMPNIKFDRFLRQAEPQDSEAAAAEKRVSPLARTMGEAPLAVFGSVRTQEEPEVLKAMLALREARPGSVLALFPRHMHRLAGWDDRLERAGLPHVRRSALSSPPPPGTVVVWDTFGELSQAYSLARAAFVGGSLKPLGGQNFLEPLACGVAPVIGPHWKNFDWVGREIVDTGLVREVSTPEELAEAMAGSLSRPRSREAVKKSAAAYARKRSGGAKAACEAVIGYLKP